MADRSAMEERAIALALEAHQGQRDWCGRPFILHPMRVGLSLLPRGELLASAGILHDSVEDSEGRVTIERVSQEVGPDVARIVAILTHVDPVTYDAYVQRVSTDQEATYVKLADLADNIAPDRLMCRGEKQERSLAKHGRALQFLRDVAHDNGWL